MLLRHGRPSLKAAALHDVVISHFQNRYPVAKLYFYLAIYELRGNYAVITATRRGGMARLEVYLCLSGRSRSVFLLERHES